MNQAFLIPSNPGITWLFIQFWNDNPIPITNISISIFDAVLKTFQFWSYQVRYLPLAYYFIALPPKWYDILFASKLSCFVAALVFNSSIFLLVQHLLTKVSFHSVPSAITPGGSDGTSCCPVTKKTLSVS